MIPFLLIGLGNPGTSYAGNRHNAGFMVIDEIRHDYGFGKPAKKFGGSLAEGVIDGQKTFTFCPLGYMNTSGVPVSEVAHFYKIPLERIIVIHDELDIPLGRLKVKRGGGHGGHNGLRSIDTHLGQEYLRVRFGIGHPSSSYGLRRDESGSKSGLAAPELEKRRRVSDYVLSDFSKAEMPAAEQMVSDISRHIAMLFKGDEAGFMNKMTVSLRGSAT